MDICIEPYEPEKYHEKKKIIAELIFRADEYINPMIYGKGEKGIGVIQKMMKGDENYFSPENIKIVRDENELVGVLVSFDVEKRDHLDKSSGKALAKVMGYGYFLKKVPQFLKMRKLTTVGLDSKGYYILYLSMAPSHRGKGIGTRTVELLSEKHDRLYVHVNIDKKRAHDFYKKAGFQTVSKETVDMKGERIGLYLMELNNEAGTG